MVYIIFQVCVYIYICTYPFLAVRRFTHTHYMIIYIYIYTAGLKVRIRLWWKYMDFKQKNCVPREKSGTHSKPVYLVLKPLKKSGTAFWIYLISAETPKTPNSKSMFSWNPCLCLLFFIMFFQDVCHYFSLIFFNVLKTCFIFFVLGRSFAIYMHILQSCSTWKTQDGRKFKILEF